MVNLKVVIWISLSIIILLAATGLAIYSYMTLIYFYEEAPCEKWKSEELDVKRINKDGSMSSNGVVYQKNETYRINNTSFGCKCLKMTCVRKCCPLHQNYIVYKENGENMIKCVNTRDLNFLDRLKFYDYNPNDGAPKEIPGHNVTLVNEELKPYCLEEKIIALKNHVLLTNGSLLVGNNYQTLKIKTIDEYCIEFINETIKYFTCAPEKLFNINDFKLQIYSACMIFSLPFLVITFLVYYFIPDLHNLVGKSLSSLTFSKIISYIMLTTVQLEGDNIGKLLCAPFGYIVQYSFLASFFWLNVMCFDIWLVFRENRPQRSMTKDEETRKFIKYATYAWGMPIVICIIVYIADIYLPETSEYKPMVGEEYCLLNTNNKSRLIFYFLPLTILLILNIGMFLTTASKIFLHKKQMASLKSKGKRISNQKDKERLNLYFRLFLIMGISWIAEPVSTIFDEKPEWFWILLDATNLLLGIMIFVIFVCKQRTLHTITTKLCPSKNYFNKNSSTVSNTDSTKTEMVMVPVNNLNSENKIKSDHNTKTTTISEMESVTDETKY